MSSRDFSYRGHELGMNYGLFSFKDQVTHFFISLIIVNFILLFPAAIVLLFTQALNILPSIATNIIATRNFFVLISGSYVIVLIIWIITYFLLPSYNNCKQRSIESLKYAFYLLLVEIVGIFTYFGFRLMVY